MNYIKLYRLTYNTNGSISIQFEHDSNLTTRNFDYSMNKYTHECKEVYSGEH